jgi:Spy/CpxP family protein refolding chaperone
MRRLVLSRNTTTLLLVVSLAFNLGLCLAMAIQGKQEEAPRSRWDRNRRNRERLADKLNLSPEQEAVMSASREQFFEELRGTKHRLHEESDVLAGLLTAPELDTNAVSQQVETIASIRDEIQRKLIEHILSIRETLEPEQLDSLKEFAGRVLSRSGRGGRHGGGPPDRDGSDHRGPRRP